MKRFAIFLSLITALATAQTGVVGDYRISGVVVDHLTTRPLNHVLVQINRLGKGGGDASVLTEADGRFTFLHVPKGKYELVGEKRGQMPQGFHADGGYATAIVVDGQQKTDALLFAMHTYASINGLVIGSDGEPVQGAQALLLHEMVIEGEAQTVQVQSSMTSSSGQFHFGHLEAGKYFISIQARPWFEEQHVVPEMVYPITFFGDTSNAEAARSIALAEGGSVDVQINLHAMPGIRVKVAGQAQGVVVFVAGPGGSTISAPASYIGATAGDAKDGSKRSRSTFYTPSTTQSSADTPMELTNLAAGRYQVIRIGANDDGGAVQTADLSDGSTVNIEAVSSSSISGTIVFDGGRPSGDLEVFLIGQRNMTAPVGNDGTFKFDKIGGGKFNIQLNNPALIVTGVMAKGARIVHDSLEVPSGAAVELTIKAGPSASLATIEGVAVRASAGVAGAMVLLMPQDLGRVRLIRRDQSDADGSFSLPAILPGRYTLLAIDDGRDLAYKSEAVIKPYLAGGMNVTFPFAGSEMVKVPVQRRR